MKIPAPYRGTVGTTTVSRPLMMYASTARYSSIGALLAAMTVETVQTTVPKGQSQKVIMARGRVGRSLVPTIYSAKYYAARYEGEVSFGTLEKFPTGYQGGRYRAGIGFTGGNGNGVSSVVRAIDPNGTLLTVEAIANRVAIQNLRNRISTQLVEKSLDQKMDLAESLATLPQTVMMVATLTMKVVRAIRALQRRDFPGALAALGLSPSGGRLRTLPKTPAKAWLELQYGWLPLLNDIYAGIQALIDGLKKPGYQFTVTRRGAQGLLLPKPSTIPGPGNWQWTHSGRAEAKVEAKMRCRVSDPTVAMLSSLGLLNPLSLAWNLLPFSFVLDWFLPVGSFLAAVGAPLGLQFLHGYMTTVTNGTMTSSGSILNSNPRTTIFRNGSSCTEEFGTIDRTSYSTWPALLPYIRLPFDSATKAASAAALTQLSQARRGR